MKQNWDQKVSVQKQTNPKRPPQKKPGIQKHKGKIQEAHVNHKEKLKTGRVDDTTRHRWNISGQCRQKEKSKIDTRAADHKETQDGAHSNKTQ